MQAQAPESIQDLTFMSYGMTGMNFWINGAGGKSYNVSHEGYISRGIVSYQKTGWDIAILKAVKGGPFDPWEEEWQFNADDLSNVTGSGIQFRFLTDTTGRTEYAPGNHFRFDIFSSMAPVSLNQKVIRVNQNFDEFFSATDFGNQLKQYEICFTSTNTYQVLRLDGKSLHSGTYSLFRPNQPTLVCMFDNNDSHIGIFAFASETSGKGSIHQRPNKYRSIWGDDIEFTVSDCTYKLSSSYLLIAREGGTSSVRLNTIAACPWTASTTNDWIQITSGSSGEGNGTVEFSVTPNDSTEPRNGFIRIAGKTFTVAQGGDLAHTSIVGKTLLLNFESGYDDQPTHGAFITNPEDASFRLVPKTTNLTHATGTYLFSKTSNTQALLNSDWLTAKLEYTNATSGTFSGTNHLGNTTTGGFVLAPTAPDLNGDVHTDLVFQSTSAVLASWFMEGTSLLHNTLLRDGIPLGSNQRAFALADFNNDGHTDIVLRNTQGRLSVWLMNGTERLDAIVLRDGIAAPPWRAFSTTDLRGNGNHDILFQHRDGRLAAWHFDQTNFIGGTILRGGTPIGAAWRAVGSGDFNGDGQSDILLQSTAGKVAVGWMNAGDYVGAEVLRTGWTPPAGLRVVGVGDLNGDGHPDILFQNSRKQLAVWIMNGKHFVQAMYLRDAKPLGIQWRAIGPK